MRARGFTLIEVVLATAVLALVMSLVFGSFFAQSRVDRAVSSEMETDQAARIFLEQMITDLSQVLAAGQKSLEEPTLSGGPINVDRLKGHELTLLTRTGDGEGEPVVRLIYRTVAGVRDDGTPSGDMSVYRRVEPLLGSEEREELICPGVASLNMFYSDAKGAESESWSDKENLPRVVRLELTMGSAQEGLKTYTLTTGPLTALAWSKTK